MTEIADSEVTPRQHVCASTDAKIRAFLYQIAEGVADYRSLHSLTQQVEHQYRGRFLIELIQNAHDALWKTRRDDQSNRIRVVLDPTDSKYGSLLIANDGRPFNMSGFDSLSQLGQSDKDPRESIGNKGIGFRSVLEITNCPELFSRFTADSATFDGYCFRFDPGVVRSLIEPMEKLAAGTEVPASPLSDQPLVDWEGTFLRKFRARVRAEKPDWLRTESACLSPYLLPVPCYDDASARVRSLQEEGFATVVRLPLRSLRAQQLVKEHMTQLSSSTVLFLDHVTALEVHIPGHFAQTITRSVIQHEHEHEHDRRRIRIRDAANGLREYVTWSRNIHVADAPPDFQSAVANLPGRWPGVQDAAVSIAVALGEHPEPGIFSIYLPTELPTGCAMHINAPFYGNMSRTEINFDDAYNHYLLQTAVDLTADVVFTQLAGKGPDEARAIVDMISPFGSNAAAGDRWRTMLDEVTGGQGGSIDTADIILADEGWRPLESTSLTPATSGTTLITETAIRQHATFEIFHTCLSSRCKQLLALAESRYDVGARAPDADVAATVAEIAADLHAHGGDWDAFWSDVLTLLPSGQAELAKYKVLLGADSELHSAQGEEQVFFAPRQGLSDAGDEGDSEVLDVPPTLRALVAFLNDAITLYRPGQKNESTPVHEYLSKKLVSPYRVEDIFDTVLNRAIPDLPVRLNARKAKRCQDVMRWSFQLMANVIARGRGSDDLLNRLKKVPAPCRGGWFPMDETSLGEGWPNTSGATLVKYIAELGGRTSDRAAERILLHPDHTAWGGDLPSASDLLPKGGVFDGLRLEQLAAGDWPSQFWASRTSVNLPEVAPSSINASLWSEYKRAVEGTMDVPFKMPQHYVVGPIYTFPGLDLDDMSEAARLALSELILHSAPRWPTDWETQTFTKRGGQRDRRTMTSPLACYLRTRPWLAVPSHDDAMIFSRPRDHWHVPANLVNRRATQFTHLHALPYRFAQRFDADAPLAAVIHRAGMPYFDLASETDDPKLMKTLISTIRGPDAPDENVLLGQIREAWRVFRPGVDATKLERLPVQRSDGHLASISPSESTHVYLPDKGNLASSLRQYDQAVVAIQSKDAESLREWFARAYGGCVTPTSELTLIPRVNGEEWMSAGTAPLRDSEIDWLEIPLLTLVAFHGPGRGVNAQAFQERRDRLHDVRIEWVDEAAAAVMQGSEELLNRPVAAHWLASRKTLLLTQQCKVEPVQMADAIAEMLERADLDLPLRFILDKVRDISEQPDNLLDALSTLRISSQQISEVRKCLQGDIGHAARMIQVLCKMIAPEVDATDVLTVQSDGQLVTALITVGGINEPPAEDIIQTAKDSLHLYDFGKRMTASLGGRGQLPRWNDALEQLGQPLLANNDWRQQMQRNLDEARGLVRRAIVQLATGDGWITPIKTAFDEYEHLPPDELDLSGACWVVGFEESMAVVADWMGSMQTGDQLATAMREAASLSDLRARLTMGGVHVDRDPDERCRENYDILAKVVDDVQQIMDAWWINHHASDQHNALRDGGERCVATLKGAIGNAAFTGPLVDADILSALGAWEPYAKVDALHDALVSATDSASLRSLLGVTSEDLANVSVHTAERKAESLLRQNTVSICGDDFDGSEGNRGQLWEFLGAHVDFAALAEAHPLNITKAAALLPIKAKKRGNRSAGAHDASTHPPRRQPKAVDETIGLAGEILVFQMLQHDYGKDVVTAASWKSANSRYVFEDNEVDDGLGCDFAFSSGKYGYRVEVKSTAGDDESFTMGSSEIALATTLASRRRSRHTKFILVHVRHALSGTPNIVVLPNPYSAASANVFTIEEADARLRYKAKP